MTAVGQSTKDQVVAVVKAAPGQTAKEIGISAAVANALVAENFLRVVSTRKHVNAETGEPSRGRPSNEYGLGKKGQGRARTLANAAAKAQVEPQEPVEVAA